MSVSSARATARSSDTFDLSDLDDARACYDERVAQAEGTQVTPQAGTAPPATSGPVRRRPGFGNAAWEWARACNRAVETSDHSRLIDLMAEDFLEVARYRLNLGQELDRHEFVDSLIAQQTSEDDVRVESELVATRGDDLALVRTENHINGYLIEFLVVGHVVDGLAKRMVMFDPAQLNEALDELDHLWGDNGAPTQWAPSSIAYRRAWTDGDGPALRRCVTDDFISVDHRLLGLGTRTADDWAESMGMLIEGIGSSVFVVRDAIEWSELVGLVWIAFDAATDESSFDMLAVTQTDDQGRFTRHELFDIDDLDRATARFHELVDRRDPLDPEPDVADDADGRFDTLTAEPADRARTFSNRAWEVGRDMVAAHDAGDRSRCASGLADTMVFVARDPIMQFASEGEGLDREAMLDMVFHEDLAGAGHVSTTELIAVRGETLCLHQITSTAANGDVSDRLYLSEINAEGLCHSDRQLPDRTAPRSVRRTRPPVPADPAPPRPRDPGASTRWLVCDRSSRDRTDAPPSVPVPRPPEARVAGRRPGRHARVRRHVACRAATRPCPRSSG